MKRIFSIIVFVLAAAALFTACKPEPVVVPSTGVSISPSTLTMMDGEWKQLSATIEPGDVTSSFITWTSSDTKIAVVDKWGRVSAMFPGTAKITATNGGQSGICSITVNPVKETSIKLYDSKLEPISTLKLKEEETASLEARVLPKNASYVDSVKWTSSNPDVAKVDLVSGEITAVSIGDAIITATTYFGLTATCTVTVEAVIPTEPETLDIWKNDKPGYRAILGGSADVTSDFLTYSASEGVVRWGANTTGRPRTATLVTGSSSITVTQVAPEDFAGNWTFTAKIFAPNTNLGVAAAASKDVPLTITAQEEKKGTIAMDGTNEVQNTLLVAGLIKTYVAEAAVVINYAAKTYKFGIFLNGKKAQAVETGKAGYNYVTLLPELGTGWGSYNFVPVPFNGESNMGWLWLVSDDLNKCHYGASDWVKMDGKDLLGFAFVACKASAPTKDDYASVNTAGGYDVIYQCNPGNTNPFVLKR